MKIKSTKTTIVYAGRTLIQPGEFFDGDAISDSLETTAQSVNMVNATYARMEHYQNAKESSTLSFVRDFDNVEDAVLYKFEAQEHAANNATGRLVYGVGEGDTQVVINYMAGLTRLDADISLSPNAVRVTLRYSFIAGTMMNISRPAN